VYAKAARPNALPASRALRVFVAMLVISLIPATAAGAATGAPGAGRGGRTLPTTIPLPDGFGPEGIAIGAAPLAYFGSTVDGSIYQADLLTGRGRILSEGPGTPSYGLEIDRAGRLFVAGGPNGDGRVVSAATGQILASYTFTSQPNFVNDVVVTPDAAWFTDSLNAVLYKLPLGDDGQLPAQDEVVTVPLTGDMVFQDGFNANGIERTPDGTALLADQTNTGLLFRVDPATGVTSTVDLGGVTLPDADGLLRDGRTLYVVRNVDNEVAVVRLDRTGVRGTVVDRVTDPRFDVPTTADRFDGRLYVTNSRFLIDPAPGVTYSAVAVPLVRS
jgi:sugar lactone lactonase YvrE